MNKNLIYLIIFIVLLIAAYFLVFREKISTFGKNDTNFELKHPEEVTKIFMADMNGKKILLERKNDDWFVNGKFRARLDGVKNILETLNKIRVFYPVPKSSHNTVVADLASSNIKVEVYDEGGDKIKSYFLGGPTMDYKGTYIMLEGAKNPYVIHIPGFEGYMTSRFFLDEEEWRNRNIFSYTAQNLKSVTIDYLEEPENSFQLTMVNEDSFQLVQLHSEKINLGEMNKQRIKEYLSFYNNINMEAFQNNISQKDSIIALGHFISMTITDVNGNENKLKIYHMPIHDKSKSQFDEQNNPLKWDLDRMYAVQNDKDFILIQYFVFNKILRSYRDFFKGVEK